MASASTQTKTGMGRTAYNEALKAKQDAVNLATYKASLADAQENLGAATTMLRDLRELHVKHYSTPGVRSLTAAITDASYQVSSYKQYVRDYQTRIAKIEGSTVVDDDDDE